MVKILLTKFYSLPHTQSLILASPTPNLINQSLPNLHLHHNLHSIVPKVNILLINVINMFHSNRETLKENPKNVTFQEGRKQTLLNN